MCVCVYWDGGGGWVQTEYELLVGIPAVDVRRAVQNLPDPLLLFFLRRIIHNPILQEFKVATSLFYNC